MRKKLCRFTAGILACILWITALGCPVAQAAEEELIPIPPAAEGVTFENPFDILNNPNVKRVWPGSYVGVYDFLDSRGFSDIEIFRTVDPDSVHLGVAVDDENVVVCQFSTKKDDLVWNVRMEKADSMENRTGIEMPTVLFKDAHVPLSISICDVSRNPYKCVKCYWYLSGDFKRKPEPGEIFPAVEMYIAYFPKTGNLYSFYIQDEFVSDGKKLESPSKVMPICILNTAKEAREDRIFS